MDTKESVYRALLRMSEEGKSCALATYNEIARAAYVSTSSARRALALLEREGQLVRGKRRHRGRTCCYVFPSGACRCEPTPRLNARARVLAWVRAQERGFTTREAALRLGFHEDHARKWLLALEREGRVARAGRRRRLVLWLAVKEEAGQ